MLNLKVKERAKLRVILETDQKALAELTKKIAATKRRLNVLDVEIAAEVHEGRSDHA